MSNCKLFCSDYRVACMANGRISRCVACVIVALALAFALAPIAATYAVTNANQKTEAELLKEKLNNISQNCASIKQSLGQLQRADSRTRIYLGASYERVLSNFLTPLSVRLARNGRLNDTLTTIEADFATTQSQFRSAYTDYMREMGNLMAIDCVERPEEFYQHLESARTRRETLRLTTVKLAELINSDLASVKKFQEGL